jgi:hypothetical protein
MNDDDDNDKFLLCEEAENYIARTVHCECAPLQQLFDKGVGFYRNVKVADVVEGTVVKLRSVRSLSRAAEPLTPSPQR